MPDDKIKINFGGKEVDATPVDVNQASERWNEYFLEDGSVIKIKLVMAKVLRVENEYDREGNPIYITQSTNVVSVDSPKSLRRSV